MVLGILLACSVGEKQVVIPQSPMGLLDFYMALEHDASSFGYSQGEWTEDYGDAAAFGSYYYSHAGKHENNEEYIQIALETKEYNLGVISTATDDFSWMLSHLEEVFMSAQGLIEYTTVFDDATTVPAIEALLGKVDPLVSATGDYMNISIGDFAADLYGPTSITAGVAVAYSQYASYQKGEYGQHMLERAEEIANTIHDEAFHEDHYRFHPEVEKQYLYPNATMLILLTRLFELTEDSVYMDRAETVFQGIQPLRYPEMNFYRSPYSEDAEGAQTDEYSTLSSQNYLMLGLLSLYEHTSDPIYLEDIFAILDHINTRLYDEDEHKIVHHWVDGRPANQNDPSYFCSGCNLQTLFILWYLTTELGVELL
jgi:hypothetical protein